MRIVPPLHHNQDLSISDPLEKQYTTFVEFSKMKHLTK